MISEVKGNGRSRIQSYSMIGFLASRYVGYGLQFTRGLLVANYLGPELFGVWGFLTLVMQYLSYSGLGLQYAINVELATESNQREHNKQQVVGAAVLMTLLVSSGLLLMGVLVILCYPSLFEKYSFSQYALQIVVIASLGNLSQVMINVYRVYGQLMRIASVEMLGAILPLGVVFLASGERLIVFLLAALIVAGVLGNMVLFIKMPFSIALSLRSSLVKYLLGLGIPLLIYNLSFYMITLTGRTVIGAFYSVDTMGYYSLATSITSTTLLGLSAISWVIFPNMLSRVRLGLNDDDVRATVDKINSLYGTSVFIIVFAMIFSLPVLFWILPQYRPAEGVVIVLLLSQAMLSLSYGHNCVAISRRRHMGVAIISLIASLVVAVLSIIVAKFESDFVLVAVAGLIGSTVFTLFQVRLGSSLLMQDGRSPYGGGLFLGSLLAAVITVAGILSGGRELIFEMIALCVFLFLNFGRVRSLVRFILLRIEKR